MNRCDQRRPAAEVRPGEPAAGDRRRRRPGLSGGDLGRMTKGSSKVETRGHDRGAEHHQRPALQPVATEIAPISITRGRAYPGLAAPPPSRVRGEGLDAVGSGAAGRRPAAGHAEAAILAGARRRRRTARAPTAVPPPGVASVSAATRDSRARPGSGPRWRLEPEDGATCAITISRRLRASRRAASGALAVDLVVETGEIGEEGVQSGPRTGRPSRRWRRSPR